MVPLPHPLLTAFVDSLRSRVIHTTLLVTYRLTFVTDLRCGWGLTLPLHTYILTLLRYRRSLRSLLRCSVHSTVAVRSTRPLHTLRSDLRCCTPIYPARSSPTFPLHVRSHDCCSRCCRYVSICGVVVRYIPRWWMCTFLTVVTTVPVHVLVFVVGVVLFLPRYVAPHVLHYLRFVPTRCSPTIHLFHWYSCSTLLLLLR